MQRIGVIPYMGMELDVLVGNYVEPDGPLALQVNDAQTGPWARVSVNLAGYGIRPDARCFVVSNDIVEGSPGLLDALATYGLAEDTGERVSYGFVHDGPVWRVLRAGE